MSETFRFAGKKLLLTYAQYEFDKEALHRFINTKTRMECMVRIAHEHHQDGNIHTHCCVMFPRKIDIKDCRYFDHQGHHCNIKVPTSALHWRNQIKYMDKEDEDAYGDLEYEPTADERFEAAREYVLQCKTLRDIYKDKEHQKAISSKVTYFENLWKAQGNRKVTEAKYKEFNIPKITDWSRSWLICGRAQSGKTQFAKSHFKNCLFVTHMDQLKDFNEDKHDGIVFDDIDFRHLPPASIIHLLDVDDERAIHCRFNVAVIPAGTRKIFTHNRSDIFNPVQAINAEQQKAIDRRLNFMEITEPLF